MSAIKMQGLDKIIKSLEGDLPKIRVGILGKNGTRSGEGDTNEKSAPPTNAEIGASHEFGTTNLPRRSFLRMPLQEKLSGAIKYSGLDQREVLKQVIKEGAVIPWMKKIALVAEDVVLQAFDTGGFGKWKPSNMKNKKNQQTLVETGQLRNAITSEVVE